MQKTSSSRRVGAHRKVDNSAKRRLALVAVATGAVSTAGAAGATAGAQQANAADEAEGTTIDLAADSAFLAQESTTDSEADAPRILEVPQEQESTSDYTAQLSSALEFAKKRAAEDAASRAPEAASPAEGILTSPFGPRWGTFHQGIDIANAIGTPILSVKDGVVIDAGPASGFGNWVRVKHDNGDITVYGHVSTIDVTVGDRVTAGQKIAGMGSEGFSTGSHLHFEIHPGGTAPVDPVPWLAEHGINVE